MSGTSKKLMKIKQDNLKQVYADAGNPSDNEILLLEQPDETDSVYRALGIPSKKDHIDETLSEIRAIKAYEKLFEGTEAFKGSFLKEMAVKYFLQLRQLNTLQGSLPKSAVKEIMNFTDKFGKALTQSSFYILAGKECFSPSYKGKEVKTFILFFVEASDSRYHHNITSDSTLIQFHSSGNDWSENRIWLKHLDTTNYDNSISMLSSNVLGVVLPFITALGFAFVSTITSIILIILIIIFFIINNYFNDHNYKKYWNGPKN